jgi:hypothetical protein
MTDLCSDIHVEDDSHQVLTWAHFGLPKAKPFGRTTALVHNSLRDSAVAR